MSPAFQELTTRIRGELADLNRMVQRVLEVWPNTQSPSDNRDTYVDSVSLNLHGFYSGIERLFEHIARHIDGGLPPGDTWHRDLLQQMAHEVADLRPAVISSSTAERLDEFRRFRHVVRHAYAIYLTPDKIAPLITVLPELWVQLQAELLAFADFLEEVDRPSDP